MKKKVKTLEKETKKWTKSVTVNLCAEKYRKHFEQEKKRLVTHAPSEGCLLFFMFVFLNRMAQENERILWKNRILLLFFLLKLLFFFFRVEFIYIYILIIILLGYQLQGCDGNLVGGWRSPASWLPGARPDQIELQCCADSSNPTRRSNPHWNFIGFS